jgi:hypothetical protein
MSIPLLWLLYAWLGLVGLFGLLAFLTIAMTLRFGLSCAATYVYTGLFAVISAGVIVSMCSYFMTVDWSQMVNLLSSSTITF